MDKQRHSWFSSFNHTLGPRPILSPVGPPFNSIAHLDNETGEHAGYYPEFNAWGGPQGAHGTTWINWAELEANWDETDRPGTLSRSAVAGAETHWAPVWDVMRTPAQLHGCDSWLIQDFRSG